MTSRTGLPRALRRAVPVAGPDTGGADGGPVHGRRRAAPGLARHRAPHARRDGPGRTKWMACWSRARSAPTRCRSRTFGRTQSTWRFSIAGCVPTGPNELFDESGRLIPELAALAPAGDKRMSASPYANGGRLTRRVADPRSRVVRPAAAQPGLGLPRDDSAVRRADARHLQGDDDRRRRRHLPVVLPG